MGKIDVIIGMWKGERRDKAHALSKPYHENVIVLIAKQEDTVDFQDLHSNGDQDV